MCVPPVAVEEATNFIHIPVEVVYPEVPNSPPKDITIATIEARLEALSQWLDITNRPVVRQANPALVIPRDILLGPANIMQPVTLIMDVGTQTDIQIQPGIETNLTRIVSASGLTGKK